MWLKKLLAGLFDFKLDVTYIFCDNHSCIKLLENTMFHDKSKHIKIKHQYIQDMVEKGAVKFRYFSTNEQTADLLAKPLSKVKFEYFRDKVGVVQKDVPRKRE